MVYCFCVLLLAPAALIGAGSHEDGGVVTSTVRVDRRSGRLVRSVTVPERIVEAKVVAPSLPGSPGEVPVRPNAPAPIAHIVDEVSAAQGVDPLLVHALIHVESRYNPYAISPKGAEGLMQLIPSTARQLGVRNSFDSRQNIEGGIRHLRQLQEKFTDLRLVLAAYNAGEGAVSRYRGIPPYAETQDYVYKVGKRYGELRRQKPAVQAAAAPPAAAPEPEHRPLESYVDPEGRLHLRTR